MGGIGAWSTRTALQRLLDSIAHATGCRVLPPRGQPVLRQQDRLPSDLAEFYRHCGGVSLSEDTIYPMRIVGPDELIRSNPEIAQAEDPQDISDTWYIVARGDCGETVSIDCSSDRLGRCYDSFWDIHAMAGSCPIVALSFTELLQRMFDGRGADPYWVGDDAPSYGDAYDDAPPRPAN